jgi:type 1 glutamine amidotransferase
VKALIASGTGRYGDPWHPYTRTSPLLAEIARDAGFSVEVDEDVDRAMTRLADVDLLIVNAGDPWRSEESGRAPEPAVEGLSEALRRGVGVLAMHAALASLRDYPEWAPAIGAMWLPGVSWHPPIGHSVVRGLTMPDGGRVADVPIEDEQYLQLQAIGRSTTVAEHEVDGERFPAVWVREVGAARVAVDALGHDERSYAAPEHRALVASLARWAARAPSA